MSDMRHLLEKMNTFAGEKVGQKPGDQVRGSEPMPRKGTKKHPYTGRLVGANESSDNLLKELTQTINKDPVKRDLFVEWHEYKEGFDSTLKSAADKIVSAGGATRDAIAGAIDSIPRPFDEKEVAKDLSQVQRTQPESNWRKTEKKVQEADDDYEEVDVIMRRPAGVIDYDKIEFTHRYKDGREVPVPIGSYYHDKWYRAFTGKETPMMQELIRGMQTPVRRGNEFVPKEPNTVQDVKIPGQDKGRYRAPLPNWAETDSPISEWGAAGTAVGPGNDDADPVEIAAQRAQQVAGKRDQQNQVAGLIAQVNGARSELAGLNKQFPQGANPVEKAMSMQQMQGQKVALGRQIEDLMRQVAGLRGQA